MSDRSANLDEILRNLRQGWIMEADAPVLLAHLDELRARAERAEAALEDANERIEEVENDKLSALATMDSALDSYATSQREIESLRTALQASEKRRGGLAAENARLRELLRDVDAGVTLDDLPLTDVLRTEIRIALDEDPGVASAGPVDLRRAARRVVDAIRESRPRTNIKTRMALIDLQAALGGRDGE